MKKAETFFRGDANDRKKTRNIFRAPANVPMMFVYTWAIGLLAGNAGIVRISERTLQRESVQDVLRVFRELFSQKAESCSPAPDTAAPETVDSDTAAPDTADSDTAEQKEGDLSPVGELIYTGPNVALGYAVRAEDLGRGDDFHGVLHTGDMARRDEDGYFYIVGRQSRFIKIAGKRIGLDEVEKILRTAFPDLDLACAGKDEDLHVFAVAAGENLTENGNENSGKNGGENKGDKAFKELEEKICSKDH